MSPIICGSVFAIASLVSMASFGAPSVTAAVSVGTQCDKLAAGPYNADNPKNVKSVEYADIDSDKAIEICTQAVELNPKVYRYKFQLARAYDSNYEYKKAAMIYHPLALRGYAAAQADLGLSYEDGLGVKESYDKSVYWYRKSAEQGNVEGQYGLGRMYYFGYGVEESDKEAMIWFLKGASQGYSPSQYRIGVMYENGYGVPQSDKEAKKWYKKAADQGDEDAIEKLQEMS